MAERLKFVTQDGLWLQVGGAARRAPALFLDRDGAVIEEKHYLSEPGGVVLIPGAAAAIRWAAERGWHVVLVTNQAGIGRGLFGWPEFAAVQARIADLLAADGAVLDAVVACPFHPDGQGALRHPDHPARKPNPGMLLAAAERLDIELAASWIVGDRVLDIAAGFNAGLAGAVHVSTGHGGSEAARALAFASKEFTVLPAGSIAQVPDLLAPNGPG
jgi:D-glycero-D-manno-heptose 1,7-bisphosphate phosphatase